MAGSNLEKRNQNFIGAHNETLCRRGVDHVFDTLYAASPTGRRLQLL
jgi:hypothetical protein